MAQLSVFPKVVLLAKLFLLLGREGLEIAPPARAEIDLPPPEAAY